MRLDQYTAQTWPEHSRSTWQKLIKSGNVTVNGQAVTSPKYEVSDEDAIQATPPEVVDYSKNTLPVVYEDESVIVINKPVGVLAHAKGALSEEFTVADFFRTRTTYNTDTNRPGIVHRLDRDTSGILIGAKTPEAAKGLARQFADRKVKKTYLAVLSGMPAEPKAVIDVPIGRNPSAPSTFRVHVDGKSAVTSYEVLQYGNTRCFVRLQPKTGRTHQLRVHMAYLHAPIYSDRVYGKAADRLYLHAASLEITIPGGRRMVFEAPVPAEFEREAAL